MEKGEIMGTIKRETAGKIWQCYREIETAEKLLKDMEETKKKYPYDPHAQHLRDSFGRQRDLQLGIPSGENSHRLFNVSPELAVSVIKSHIATQKAALIEANEQAHIEFRNG